MDTADIFLLEVPRNQECPADPEAVDHQAPQEWEVPHEVVAEVEEVLDSVAEGEVISQEEIAVEVVVISVVEEGWTEAVEEAPGMTGEDLVGVVQEVEEALGIVEAEGAVGVAVHQNVEEVHQVPVDHLRDQGSINHLLNLQMVTQLSRPVKGDMEEALVMHTAVVSNSRNNSKQ